MKVITDVNDFLKNFPEDECRYGKLLLKVVRPRAVCDDGYSISIQANEYTYCMPRVHDAEEYESVELGYPSQEDELINDYADCDEDYTKTVYGYVPVEVVNELIEKHGGITRVIFS